VSRHFWVIEYKPVNGRRWARDKAFLPHETKKAGECRVRRIPSFIKVRKLFRLTKYVPEVK